jgi:threonine aldolase
MVVTEMSEKVQFLFVTHNKATMEAAQPARRRHHARAGRQPAGLGRPGRRPRAETGEDTQDWGRAFDSLSICLSKGLGAPVGSLLVGRADFIAKARRLRKGFGGGMRQIGILCAAGLHALDHHVDRLREDHAHARRLAAVLVEQPYVAALRPVHTNILIFDLAASISAEAALASLARHGIKASAFGPQTIRFVTHLDVTAEMIEAACALLAGPVRAELAP